MRSRLGTLVRRFYHRPPKQQTGFGGFRSSSRARRALKCVATEVRPRACRQWKPHAHNVRERLLLTYVRRASWSSGDIPLPPKGTAISRAPGKKWRAWVPNQELNYVACQVGMRYAIRMKCEEADSPPTAERDQQEQPGAKASAVEGPDQRTCLGSGAIGLVLEHASTWRRLVLRSPVDETGDAQHARGCPTLRTARHQSVSGPVSSLPKAG